METLHRQEGRHEVSHAGHCCRFVKIVEVLLLTNQWMDMDENNMSLLEEDIEREKSPM